MTSSSSFGDLCLSTSSLSSLNSVTFNDVSNSLKSSSSSSSTSNASREETTFASKAFVFKWTLVGYPFTSVGVRSEDFVATDITGDVWSLQLDPPKLRVDKGGNGNVDLASNGSHKLTVPYPSVYSTSTQDMQSLSTPPPPVRFAGFEYTTECMLSLILKRRGSTMTGEVRDTPLKVGFEICLASGEEPNKQLYSWVSLAESFTPFSEYPTKVLSFRGKVTDLVTIHKLSTLVITCKLFYPNNICHKISDTYGNHIVDGVTDFHENHSLVSDMKLLFADMKKRRLWTDVSLVGVDGKVDAHRVILVSRSPVLREALEKDFNDFTNNTDNQTSQIKMYGVPVKILRLFVSFMYTDTIHPDDLKDCNIELLLLADKYKMPKLKLLCEHSVARSLNEDNCSDIVSLSRTVKSTVIQRKLHEFFNH